MLPQRLYYSGKAAARGNSSSHSVSGVNGNRQGKHFSAGALYMQTNLVKYGVGSMGEYIASGGKRNQNHVKDKFQGKTTQ